MTTPPRSLLAFCEYCGASGRKQEVRELWACPDCTKMLGGKRRFVDWLLKVVELRVERKIYRHYREHEHKTKLRL